MVWKELRAVQQGEAQSPAPGREQPHAPVRAGDQPPGKQLCTKGPESLGGRQAEGLWSLHRWRYSKLLGRIPEQPALGGPA